MNDTCNSTSASNPQATLIIQTEIKSDVNIKQIETCNFNISFEFNESPNKETSKVEKVDETEKETNKQEETSMSHEQTKSKIELYMNALVHSASCTSDTCTFTKCLQFKRVTRHNKICKSFLNDRCEFCRQLIAISVYHAKNCTNNLNCPVPFCYTIKQKLEFNKSIEFVSNYLKKLNYKVKSSKSTQTSVEDLNENNTKKRKHSSLEDDDTSISPEELQRDEDIFKNRKDEEMILEREKFFDKIKEINEEKETNESMEPCINPIKLNKMNREKLFTNIFDQITIRNNKTKALVDKLRYAKLVAFLLRKEVEFNSSRTHSNYLYLLTEMFYNVEAKLGSFDNKPFQTIQTECCSPYETATASATSSCNSSKRLKTE